MEAYIGIRPTRETFARFFALRINSVQGVDIPAPKPPVQCGSIISSRQGSPFFKFSGLESCRLWQGTFFYVKNNGAADLIGLPPFDPAPPAKTNWGYNPKESHNETNRIIRFMRQKMKDTGICSDDIVRTFISRRVLPLKRRAHRMSEMPRTASPSLKQSGEELAGSAPLTPSTQIPTFLEGSEDGQDPGIASGPVSAKANRIHEHVPPLRAEAGSEFVDKLMAQGQKNKRPSSDDGSSQAPPSKRFRTEPLGEKKVGMRRYGRKQMPTASGPALKLGPRPSGSEGSARTSTPPPSSPAPPGAGNTSASLSGGTTNSGRAAPSSSDHRTEEDLSFFPENQDTGTSNIGAGEENVAGQAEPPAPPVLEKKTTSAPESSASEGSNPGDAPIAPPSPRTILMPPPSAPSAQPSGPLAPPPRTSRLIGEGDGSQRLFCRPAAPGSGASSALRPEVERRGRTPATRGLGKDRLPAPDPVGNRSSEEHFTRLRCAVKELDSAWYDATNNLMLTADARKTLFEELLWEHRELAEAHDNIPEASIDALKEQLANAQLEKEQLIKQHQEELSAQKTSYQELKSQLIQLGLDHAKVLKAAEADAAAKMDEALEDASNATVVLRAELEELAKARKLPAVARRARKPILDPNSYESKGARQEDSEWQYPARAGADSASASLVPGTRSSTWMPSPEFLTAGRIALTYRGVRMRTYPPPEDYLMRRKMKPRRSL
ncbi:hypothetical protein QYE76_036745 [Lolium multiflorum]|uniref:Uncharacterized protein n=1 Tax=Lolium multiflorum TaxID=4521 RepID=A0AAD8R2J6_LOLMU|nr:hypothetical protein QYE76_036745 [Lolium multiflorum]